MPVIFLLTDFGLADPYVGQMKAALHTHAPDAVVIDLTHQVPAHNVATGAFFLRASAPHCPEGSVILGVVDPGVGSRRSMVIVDWCGRLLLGPDNGLLSLLLDDPGVAAWRLPPADGLSAATFQGRDVFAPLAARLARGEHPDSLATRVEASTLVRLPWEPPSREGDRLTAAMLHVDAFGNAILNLPAEEPLATSRLMEPRERVLRRTDHYAALEPGELGLLRGSQGFYELALNQDSAARELGLKMGDRIVLSLEPGNAQ